MIGSILVKMPEITREFDDSLGIEVINKYFVRLKSDVYIPIFNIPLLHPEILYKNDYSNMVFKLTHIMYKYYEKYLELRKQKQFELSVFLPEKYGGYALYYLLQKFMIGEATPKEIKIISEFLSRDIFDGKDVRMDELLEQYYMSIFRLYLPNYNSYKKRIFVNTPVGITPLYISDSILHPSNMILKTLSNDYYNIAFVNVLTSHFFGESIQIGSTKFRFLKSIGELDFNWSNVSVISFKELYDISDAIIENNLEMAFPRTSVWMYADERRSRGVFLSHSPVLSSVGAAIDFKSKSVVFLFAVLKRKSSEDELTKFNKLNYLNDKNIEFFVTIIPFKNIKKFIYRDEGYSCIFIIKQNSKTIPVLSLRLGPYWIGVGRENTVIRYDDYSQWYGLLRKLASPEHLKKAVEKTQDLPDGFQVI